MGKDFVDVAFDIFKDKENYSLIKLNNTISSRPLSELDFYTKSFPVKRGLDHPNEISAYMFSNFFKAGYNSKSPFLEKQTNSSDNYNLFLNWIKTDMK